MIVDHRQLSKEEQEALIEKVAKLEAILQPIDGWTATSISHSLEQHGRLMVITYEEQVDQEINTTERSNDGYVTNATCLELDPLIAYCLYTKVFDTAEILRIGTHPNWQGQGNAKRLLLHILQSLRLEDVDNVMLEVRADNIPAQRLYQSLGFKTIHIRQGYYHQPIAEGVNQKVDAWVMKLLLG